MAFLTQLQGQEHRLRLEKVHLESTWPDFSLALLGCGILGKKYPSLSLFPRLLEYGGPRNSLPFRVMVTSNRKQLELGPCKPSVILQV